mmetsp:Transcript_29283/g.57489  ORF Transcript_29283/g.57489 Transcript_29283/m.57489 type:complete len:143 (+) Transcript_29283:685-1113(+)
MLAEAYRALSLSLSHSFISMLERPLFCMCLKENGKNEAAPGQRAGRKREEEERKRSHPCSREGVRAAREKEREVMFRIPPRLVCKGRVGESSHIQQSLLTQVGAGTQLPLLRMSTNLRSRWEQAGTHGRCIPARRGAWLMHV